jgi:hypothetical protein
MEQKQVRIMKNKAKIESLKIDYRNTMAKMVGVKDWNKFKEMNSKAMSMLNKIEELKKKNQFMREGLPSNGYSDYHDDVNIIK